MKNILLTGGSGFIGSNIIGKIKKKFDVSILIRNKKHIKKNSNVNYLYFKNLKNLSQLLKKKNLIQ
jgi:nucleoside-diphosphate-sugar epimerase